MWRHRAATHGVLDSRPASAQESQRGRGPLETDAHRAAHERRGGTPRSQVSLEDQTLRIHMHTCMHTECHSGACCVRRWASCREPRRPRVAELRMYASLLNDLARLLDPPPPPQLGSKHLALTLTSPLLTLDLVRHASHGLSPHLYSSRLTSTHLASALPISPRLYSSRILCSN